jgi:hypothetical protein
MTDNSMSAVTHKWQMTMIRIVKALLYPDRGEITVKDPTKSSQEHLFLPSMDTYEWDIPQGKLEEGLTIPESVIRITVETFPKIPASKEAVRAN